MSMRARIVLRAAGLFPNDDKEQEKELVDEEVERIKNGNGEGVTMDQILQAFSDGDEVSNFLCQYTSLRLRYLACAPIIFSRILIS